MKKITFLSVLLCLSLQVFAQQTESFSQDSTLYLTLDDALKIALSENISVKVADREITRSEYALKGTYASLFPQVDISGTYQRTIKKQVMYMDFDVRSFIGGTGSTEEPETLVATQGEGQSGSAGGGIEVGRWNTFAPGLTASMPLVNVQLWKSIEIAGQDVELAIEKARASKLEMVTQVKQAFFSTLLAKEELAVYEEVLNNAIENFKSTEMHYNVQKASELDYNRAKTTVSNAIPAVYECENSIFLALWQLKALIGLDLDTNIDIVGTLDDFSSQMFRDIVEGGDASLDNNTTMKQLAIQAEELANAIKVQKAANIPSLAVQFSYSLNAMTNDFNFSEYQWSPYSAVGFSLAIPIFAGGKRHSSIKQAQIQYNELQMQTMDTERQLKIAIRQYLNEMETAMKSYSAADEAVGTAEKSYSIAVQSYNVGRSPYTDLIASQLALTQARLSRSQTIYSFLVSKSNLEKTLGNDFTNE